MLENEAGTIINSGRDILRSCGQYFENLHKSMSDHTEFSEFMGDCEYRLLTVEKRTFVMG